jgi:hypothetical protein
VLTDGYRYCRTCPVERYAQSLLRLGIVEVAGGPLRREGLSNGGSRNVKFVSLPLVRNS